MLDYLDKNTVLAADVERAKTHRQKYLGGYARQIEQYRGAVYREPGPSPKGEERGEYLPENSYFAYVALMLGRLVYSNPRVRVSTRRPGTQRQVAEAIRHGLNRWVRDTTFLEVVRQVALDAMFRWGIALVTQEENPSQPDDAPDYVKDATKKVERPFMWPKIARVSPWDFFVDPNARTWESARYMGHSFVRDVDDLIAEAEENPESGWDAAVLRELAVGAGVDELHRPSTEQREATREVVLYEAWVPELELEDSPGRDKGFNGTIITVAPGAAYGGSGVKQTKYPRKPRPAACPVWGPYVLFGMYPVPDELFPLGPLTAIDQQIQDLNRVARRGVAAMQSYKKFVGVSAQAASDGEVIVNAEHDDVVVFENLQELKGHVEQFEKGGIDAQFLTQQSVSKQRVDENLGITDVQRGNVTGAGTATENALADAASQVRIEFPRLMIHGAASKVLRAVAYHMYYTDRIVFPVGSEAAEEMGMKDQAGAVEPWFLGGRSPEEGGTFYDLELEIEPYSMERTSEAQQARQSQAVINYVLQTAPMRPQMPWVKWKELDEFVGRAFNLEQLGEFSDNDMAMQVAGLMMAQAADPKANQPRLQGDVGGAGLYGSGSVGGKPKAAPQPMGKPAKNGQAGPSMGQSMKVG